MELNSAKIDKIEEKPKNEDENKRNPRKRKRQILNNIRNQMEFYFGDANLSKDRFLKQLITKDPYVPLDIFLSFNKLKALTSSVEDIAKSLSTSQLLELDESQQKVKRRTALPADRNVDDKTLYVECLPHNADHEWVRQLFERFGAVTYVSLPRYAKSRKLKEFGFIEFEEAASVDKAVKSFNEFNGVLCMDNSNPAELTSVKSFLKEQAGEDVKSGQDSGVEEGNDFLKFKPTDCLKRADASVNSSDDEKNDGEPLKKRLKTSPSKKTELAEAVDDDSTSSSNEDDEQEQQTAEAANATSKDVSKTAEQTSDLQQNASQRKRRKHKSKSKKLKTLDHGYYDIKILPKKDWKRLRNKYLNLQREKVAELKRKIWQERQQQQHSSHDGAKTNTAAAAEGLDAHLDKVGAGTQHNEQGKKLTNRTEKRKLQKINMNFYGAGGSSMPDEDQSAVFAGKKPKMNPVLEKPALFSYEPRLIVELKLLEPCVNVKEFKAEMRQYNTVKYIDIKEGAMHSHLRLESAETAENFVRQVSCAEYQCRILDGEAESDYWKKIERDREMKLTKQVKVPQKRGRERVKKLLSKHIRFDDDEEEAVEAAQ